MNSFRCSLLAMVGLGIWCGVGTDAQAQSVRIRSGGSSHGISGTDSHGRLVDSHGHLVDSHGHHVNSRGYHTGGAAVPGHFHGSGVHGGYGSYGSHHHGSIYSPGYGTSYGIGLGYGSGYGTGYGSYGTSYSIGSGYVGNGYSVGGGYVTAPSYNYVTPTYVAPQPIVVSPPVVGTQTTIIRGGPSGGVIQYSNSGNGYTYSSNSNYPTVVTTGPTLGPSSVNVVESAKPVVIESRPATGYSTVVSPVARTQEMIKLTCPKTAPRSLRYTLNGNPYTINPGYSQRFPNDRQWIIEFQRDGAGSETARFTLKPGNFQFEVGTSGWDLNEVRVASYTPSNGLGLPPAPTPIDGASRGELRDVVPAPVGEPRSFPESGATDTTSPLDLQLPANTSSQLTPAPVPNP